MVASPSYHTYGAGAAISARRVVKFGASDGLVITAVDGTAYCVGLSDQSADVASGDRVDVIKDGFGKAVCGATITRGDPLTADSLGRVVKAVPAAGVNNFIVGFAEISGVVGDIIDVFVQPSTLQG